MRRGNKRLVLIVMIFVVIASIAGEFALRKLWGFGEMAILFDESPLYEYIAQPNQDKIRFGNRVVYNEYSMRSLPLKDSDDCIVLGFGDSVINGGALTDQDSLATTIVEQRLKNERGEGYRFLNVSAGSWGPDNCAAYLEKYGAFDARVIVLFVSSHDAHDNMTFEKIVGVHRSYPDRAYPLAVLEVLDRYIKPRIMGLMGSTEEPDELMINKGGKGLNPGFEYFKNYSIQHNIPLIVCLHAESAEVEAGKFNSQGQEILNYCEANGIKLISGIDIGEQLSDFRDHIHINEAGQKRWARRLYDTINETIKECK